MSPELIAPDKYGVEISRPTSSSDCYAFGMVIYETISGNFPFHKYTDFAVFVKVLEGERPPREGDFPDSLWEMLGRCWAPEPSSRPAIQEVLECLGRVSQSWEPISGEVEDVDEGAESDTSSDISVLSPTSIDDDLSPFKVVTGTGASANKGMARSSHPPQEPRQPPRGTPLTSLSPPISGYDIPHDFWDNVLVPGTFGAPPRRIWDFPAPISIQDPAP